jgi:hypothetical protein
MVNRLIAFIKKILPGIDIRLLIFLLLFLNVKLVFKILAIVIIYILQFNFKFGFRFRAPRLPLFYPLVMGIAILNWLLNKSYIELNQNISFLSGLVFWALCILAVHQIKLFVDRNDPIKIHNTLVAFFVINAVASFSNYILIIIETGSHNPYQFQGLYQKYFIGTGDKIRGITFDTSTTNALLNAFAVVYFINRKNIIMTLVCMTVLLLAGSNFTNFIITGTCLYLFLFQSDRIQKSLIILCWGFLVVFMAEVSPQNNEYILTTFEKAFPKDSLEIEETVTIDERIDKPDFMLTPEEKKQKIAKRYLDSLGKEIQKNRLAMLRKKSSDGSKQIIPAMVAITKPEIKEPDLRSEEFQRNLDTTVLQKELLQFAKTNEKAPALKILKKSASRLPGKLIATQQVYTFFEKNPQKIVLGNGMGNFSSKLAFRATGLKIVGWYPERFAYINSDFKENHLAIYLFYFSKDAQLHSITNSPNSVYNQIASEYGITGFLVLLIFYFGFFLKHVKKLSYGIPILLLMAAAFLVDYWFEQLSIVIVFELFLFLNIKDNTVPDERA